MRYARKKKANPVAVAAAVAVALAALLLVSLPRLNPTHSKESAWTLALDGQSPRALRAGDIVQTSAIVEARLESEDLGVLTLQSGSRLRLLAPDRGMERFALDYGTLRAVIWAPPARFAVDTRYATAVDLGCVYTLRTDEDGSGRLTVEAGWVALQSGNLESFIPSGASCRIRTGKGPGLPLYGDAPEEFVELVDKLDAGDESSISTALAKSRQRDALTLWHLLPRVSAESRLRVARRYATLVTLPPEVHVDDLAALRPQAMDAAWNALELGNTEWWRTWKQRW